MTTREISKIQAVGEETYNQIYVPARLASDSRYPFGAGDHVALRVIDAGDEGGVIVTPRGADLEALGRELIELAEDSEAGGVP